MENEWDKCWENHQGPNFFGRIRINKLVKIISKYLPRSSNFLDIGIGPGDVSMALKLKGYSQSGIDNSKKSIILCKKRGLKAEVGNAFKIKNKDNTFNLTFSDGLLEHFSDIKDVNKLITEHIRVSKKYIFISLPSTYWTNKLYRIIRPFEVEEYRIPYKDFLLLLRKFKNVKTIKSGYYNFGLCYYVLLEKKS